MIDHKNINEIVIKLIKLINDDINDEIKNDHTDFIEYISSILSLLVGSFSANVYDMLGENYKQFSFIDEIFKNAFFIEKRLKEKNCH